MTIVLLFCNIFTHIYTGTLAVVIFLLIMLFNLIIKAIKTRSLPKLYFGIFIISIAIIIGGLALMFIAYPGMFSLFNSVVSYANGSTTSTFNGSPSSSDSFMVFLTIPFLLGLLATIKVFYNDIKEKLPSRGRNKGKKNVIGVLSNKGILAGIYLVMTAILVLFSVMETQYQSRFLLLSFIPIALLVPIGLQFIDNLLDRFLPSKKVLSICVIAIIAILFASSSLYAASDSFSSMGPIITTEQYNALSEIKTDYIDNSSSQVVVAVNEFHIGYWAQFVLGTDVFSGNQNSLESNYSNYTIYYLDMDENQNLGNDFGGSNGLWNPLLPYSFFIGFDLKMNSLDSQSRDQPGSNPPGDDVQLGDIRPVNSNGSQANQEGMPPTNGSDGSQTPPNEGNNTPSNGVNDAGSPSNEGNNTPINGVNATGSPPNEGGNMDMSGNNMGGMGFNIENSDVTLLFSLNNVKFYLINSL